VKVLLGVPLAGLLAMSAWAQRPSALPRFEDFPVGEVFNGKSAPPKLVSPGDRAFRTRIREGAAKGPNFAGHYTIAEWGCGSNCVSMAVVDAQNGDIYSGPFGILGEGLGLVYADVSEERPYMLLYKLTSRLFVVRGCPEDKNCASYYYEWTGSQFKLLRKIVAVPITVLPTIAHQTVPDPRKNASPNGCCPIDGALLSPRQMKARLRHSEPVLPPSMGNRVRVKGVVVLVVGFSASGDVTCLQVVSGHPLLIPSAMESLKRWKFQPLADDPRRETVCGKLVLALSTTEPNMGLQLLDEKP